jgi:UDP:flavonoid glycosyltransferase YjiC (YdhE family)
MPVPRPPTKDYSLKAPRRGHLVFVAGTEGTTKDWLLYFTETSASICRALGREGVLVGGTGKSNESRPDSGLTSVAFRPLNEVLAGAVAIVHHGGIGTAAAALEHGVPQIALPRVFMQPMNAEWISRLGVCSVVNPRAWTVCNGVRLLKEMIGNEEVTRRAQEIAHRIDRRAALMNVCRFLEEPANYF